MDLCDICESRRTPPSLTQPSLITVTKDEASQQTGTGNSSASIRSFPFSKQGFLSLNSSSYATDLRTDNKISNAKEKFQSSRSSQIFDEVPQIVEVPMASFEQDLDDEVEFVEEISAPGEEWTCKKCTLVNSHRVKACVVCGGSKLRSISAVEDMTLRKGEFWSCTQCTLKNSLSTSTCIACKSARQIPIISGQQTNFRPYTSSPAQPSTKSVTPSYHHNRQILAQLSSNSSSSSSSSTPSVTLAPPAHRVSRSPSPRHDRNSSGGAIPKVEFMITLV